MFRPTRAECSPTWMRWSVRWISWVSEWAATLLRLTTCLRALWCSRMTLIGQSRSLRMQLMSSSLRLRKVRPSSLRQMLISLVSSSTTSNVWLSSVVRVWASTSLRMTLYRSNCLDTWRASIQTLEDSSLRSDNKRKLILIKQWLHFNEWLCFVKF